MTDVIVGVIAIVAGAIFCFRGYLAMRTMISLWAGFVGFALGAALVAGFTQQPLLDGPVAWAGAIAAALLLAWLAYVFYAAAVVLTMGSVGYGLGTAVVGPLGLPAWALGVSGLVGGLLLVVIALATNLPAVLLIVAAAFGGASAIVTGIAVLLGLLPVSHLEPDAVAPTLDGNPWLGVVYLILVVAGIASQARRRSSANLRADYR